MLFEDQTIQDINKSEKPSSKAMCDQNHLNLAGENPQVEKQTKEHDHIKQLDQMTEPKETNEPFD